VRTAALALTEAVTRLSQQADSVSDEVWEEAARYYDEKGSARLALIGVARARRGDSLAVGVVLEE
jgi:hypothetical protein